MNEKTYKAFIVSEQGDTCCEKNVIERNIDDLPPGDLLVRVKWSSLNYKDALSASGHKGITKKYPHQPGIDAAGVVIESEDDSFSVGDSVIVTGHDLGMDTPGGFGQYIRIPSSWAVKCPENLTLRESMIYGTAGFTAGLSVIKLEGLGITPEKGEVLVTGATGGVGSMAAGILALSGYSVTASTGKQSEHDYLTRLGVSTILHRDELADESGRPLLKGRWAGVVDTVGGTTLSTALRSTQQHGVVTSCGNVASNEFSVSIFPFILRGVTLAGIDSASTPRELRVEAWRHIAERWKLPMLEEIATECSLEDLWKYVESILKGKVRGRIIVNLD